ncbi:hypothetical protein D3C80_1876030 [compost metagenome]
MRVIFLCVPGDGILQHVVKGLADHKRHHNEHQLVQLLIHNLRRPHYRILCKLQRVLLQGSGRNIVRQPSGHQHRKEDNGQKCDFELVAERLPAQVLQALSRLSF